MNKIKSYRCPKKILLLRRRKGKKRRQKILDLTTRAFSVVTSIWFLQKKLTLLTLIWFMSILGYNAGNNVAKEHIRTSKEEIHRLKENLQELPQLRSRNQKQEVQLKKITIELKEKEAWGENFRAKSLILQDDLDNTKQKFEQTKKQLDKTLAKKDESLQSLRKKIHQFELQSKKDNLSIESYKNQLKQESEKLNEFLQITQIFQHKNYHNLNNKKLEISKLSDSLDIKINELENSQKELEKTKSDLEFHKNLLKEQKEHSNKQELEIKTLKLQIKQDTQFTQKLEEKLKINMQEFLQVRQELKQLAEKLKRFESKGQIQWIFFTLEKIINSSKIK